MVSGFICLCIGGIMLVEAPGEMVRMELQRLYEYNPGLPADMYWTPLMFQITFAECFWPVTKLWLPLLALIGYYVFGLPKGQHWNKITKFQAVMLAGALSVMLVMLFVPMAPGRAGFFSTVAVIAASVSALKALMPQWQEFYLQRRALCRSGLAACLIIMYAQYYGWKKVITDGEDRRL